MQVNLDQFNQHMAFKRVFNNLIKFDYVYHTNNKTLWRKRMI